MDRGGDFDVPDLSYINDAQSVCPHIKFSSDGWEAYRHIGEILWYDHGILTSDRRFSECIAIVQAVAALRQHSEIRVEDLFVLRYAWWQNRTQIQTVADVVLSVTSPNISKINKILESAHILVKGWQDSHFDTTDDRINALGKIGLEIRKMKEELEGMKDADAASAASELLGITAKLRNELRKWTSKK